MNGMLVVVFPIYFVHIQTENITLNPGDEKLYSILTGDTITLQCPMNSSKKSEVRWSYMKGKMESILSIGEKSNAADFSFSVDFTKNPHIVTYLRIYNITSKEQRIYKCYHSSLESNIITFEYDYNIRLANVTNSFIRNTNRSLCCVLHGQKISSNKFIWEQRTLYGEHIRFIESVQKNDSGTLKQDANLAMHKYRSCLNLNKNGILKYEKEGEYICTAQFFFNGRNQMVDKTTSIKIENIPDRPFCIQDTRRQHRILGTNIRIVMKFYSKPKYSTLSFRKNDNEQNLGDIVTVSHKNISLDVYNVTIMVSGYEIILNITEFSEEDVGNYTVNIANEFGYCNCTVQLLFEEDINIIRHPSGNVIEGQSVLFICQSINRRTTNNYSWTKNGITLSNSSSIVLENITQDDNGNYTCRMKNKQRYFTKNELLIVNPLSCTAYLPEPHGLLLLKRFLGIGNFIVPFVLLVVALICNIFIHLYCKKLKMVTLETDEDDISREQIEVTEADNGYHTINEDNFRIEDTEIENQSEITSSIRALDIAEVQYPGAASDGNELQIEDDDYLHPYCTVMQNAIEMHEYNGIVSGVVQHDGSDVVLNRELRRLYENLKY